MHWRRRRKAHESLSWGGTLLSSAGPESTVPAEVSRPEVSTKGVSAMCLPVKPYKIEREWKHAGLSCAVVLAREAAHRCGYVRVPPGHPMFGKGYDDPDVDVHGGLTFAELEPCKEHEGGQGWWFGFDCHHFNDMGYDPNATI